MVLRRDAEKFGIILLLHLDKFIQGGGVGGNAAVTQHDFKRLRGFDSFEILFSVLQPETKKPAVSRGSVVNSAGNPMIREFSLPGYAVDLLDRNSPA